MFALGVTEPKASVNSAPGDADLWRRQGYKWSRPAGTGELAGGAERVGRASRAGQSVLRPKTGVRAGPGRAGRQIQLTRPLRWSSIFNFSPQSGRPVGARRDDNRA